MARAIASITRSPGEVEANLEEAVVQKFSIEIRAIFDERLHLEMLKGFF